MASRRVVSFSRIPTITSKKLNGKNYLSWSASVQLWFLDQGFHDHLEQDGSNVPSNQVEQWKRTDFQLSYFGNLWNPNDWACFLKQRDHDMLSFMNFKHVRDQLLTGHEVSSMESLTTRLFWVPTLQRRNVQEPTESFVMVSTHGRGGRNARGHGEHSFPNKTTNISKIDVVEPKFSEEEYPKYLRLKSNNLAQSSTNHNLSIACISQPVESQSPLIIDSIVSNHISECGTGRLIGEECESRGLYYFGNSPHVSCFSTPSAKFYMIV
ncbi:hypothetical protein PHAVU_003G067000 [Phaseolus vulgaris]|uniref:Retrotransposon Copia-like N-terminal domain-containing protein n=1 Tax=Phaseolus vulgaris TaxID=3885 RepID=V7C8X5_PHAVU|nr:hypothetical protein PHAVU_003G067000g [Phaseolus vulgaris]ESW25808.1 hypothetical protein PHAVU_003G067000g [Phaseolus vulgaris]